MATSIPQLRLIQQLPGEQNAPGLRDRDRRSTQMTLKKPAQLPLSDRETVRQRAHVLVVQRAAFNHLQRARDGRGTPAPRIQVWRAFRTATQARSKPGGLRRRGRGHKRAICELRRSRRTDGPTVNAGGFHAGEKPSIIAGIARQHRSITGFTIQFHGRSVGQGGLSVWRFSDVDGKCFNHKDHREHKEVRADKVAD